MAIPVIMQELKKIERSLSDISSFLHLTHDVDGYAGDFLRSLCKLLDEYHDGMDMNDYILDALKICCELYKADWCGIIVADATSGIWGPAEWYSVTDGPMAPTYIHENEYFEDFPKWVEALNDNKPIIIPKVEKTVAHRHYLRYKAKNLVGVPFTFRPTGFIILRNAERYIDRPEFLKLIVFGGRLIYQTPINIMTPQQREAVSEVRLNIFGTPSITIMEKTITAQDYKAPVAWKLLVYFALNQSPKSAYELAAILMNIDHATKEQANSIRAAIYRTRDNLTKKIPQDLIINYNNKGYMLNPKLKISTDADEMEKTWAQAQITIDPNQKVKLLCKAFELYKGKVYDACSHESWLMGCAARYEHLYIEISNALMSQLFQLSDFATLEHYAFAAYQIEHDNIDLMFWLIVALEKNGNHNLASKKISEAQDNLTGEEYDVLMERMRKINNG